jgi:hypothetical protein
MEAWTPEAAARWIVEAVETGNPLGPLPADAAPRDAADGMEVAAEVLARLEIVPCGLRLLRRAGAATLAGPMIEGRLVPSGAPVALGALRHPVVTAAVIGVLAEKLEGDAAPVFARLHPAIDVSSTRFTEAPGDEATLTADLARLGLVVAGKGRVAEPGPMKPTLAPKGVRKRGAAIDLAAAFAEAASLAREMGGLPAGALLVVAGLTPPAEATGTLRASLGALGGVDAVFA